MFVKQIKTHCDVFDTAGTARESERERIVHHAARGTFGGNSASSAW